MISELEKRRGVPIEMKEDSVKIRENTLYSN